MPQLRPCSLLNSVSNKKHNLISNFKLQKIKIEKKMNKYLLSKLASLTNTTHEYKFLSDLFFIKFDKYASLKSHLIS